MAVPSGERVRFDFRPTLRQRRLRVLSAVVLLIILSLVAAGVTQPFFRSVGSPQVRELARQAMMDKRAGRTPTARAEHARRAAAVRVAVIGAYWTLCFLLSALLLILAWLDVREVRKKLLAAQRQLAELHPPRRSCSADNGADHGG